MDVEQKHKLSQGAKAEVEIHIRWRTEKKENGSFKRIQEITRRKTGKGKKLTCIIADETAEVVKVLRDIWEDLGSYVGDLKVYYGQVKTEMDLKNSQPS